MLAVFVNCAAVLAGSLVGWFFHKKIRDEFRNTVFTATGTFTLVIAISMALKATLIVQLALSLVVGGILGSALDIEGKVYAFGDFLKKLAVRGALWVKNFAVPRHGSAATREDARPASGESTYDFALGFLNASVLFCVGTMSIVGSFKAGTEGDYTLIFTKSVLDGFMAILLTAALGPGVALSAFSILLYQGGLTLLAGVVKPWVTPLMLSELTGAGGALMLMIGFNLLQLKQIKTGNFLPALVFIVALVLLNPYMVSIPSFFAITSSG